MRTPDLELSRTLEGAEAECCRVFCLAAAEVHPGRGIRPIPCGGGYSLFCGDGNALNGAKGVGLNGSVDLAEWDRLEEFLRSRRSASVVDLSPFAERGFVEALQERGYRIGSFETVNFRELGDELPGVPAIPGCTIAPAADPVAWARIVALGFADGGEPLDFGIDLGRIRSRLTNSWALLATIDGEPAGGAAFSVSGGVAHMAGAAVLPRFRRRGIQNALTATRLRMARDLGCSLAKLDVQGGSASHRNALRAGFHVAYTRPQLVRAW